LGAAASIALLAAASGASAATIVDHFTFYDAASDPLATGSFSYDSSHSGLLTYADLDTFAVKVLGETFDLSFVDGLNSANGDYVYFGYDTLTKTFDPGSVSGYAGPYSGILAGLGDSPNTGFFFDPLPGQGDPANTGADGVLERIDNQAQTVDTASSFSISVPEPTTWAMMIMGLLGVGAAARVMRHKQDPAPTAAEA
jgi:hypothetical protein